MRLFLSGARTQFWLMGRQPDDLLTLCTIPFTVVMLLSIVMHAARPDLVANAFLAPTLIGLWGFSTGLAAEVLVGERWNATLQLGMAAPGAVHPVYLGRISAVMVLGVVPLGETWLLGKLLFGVTPPVHHPWVFWAAMAASVFAMTGTSLLLAASMLLSKQAHHYLNFLSFPIYLLSGVMVPVQYLPEFLQPLSHVIFLSSSADLMRDSMAAGPVSGTGWRLLAIVGLGVAALVGGRVLVALALRRAREVGTVTYA
ncbi:ABC transporter permease [Saccharothrix sp. NRRL B-16314]|uniref:ABC transporter permease n=1 Tax=Saccharothrix sp. NRRL B-16314 TaxID=1463825 RepID=UPI000527C7EE|nr:ABC transporter permease [Saccharothrix sp. NRRL B-16314]